MDDVPVDEEIGDKSFVKRQKAYRVLRVRPDTTKLDNLPSAFKEILIKENRYQDKTFTLIVIPLTHKEYYLYKHSRYSLGNTLKILNEHIIPIDTNLKYILRFPMLVREIIDQLYSISGEEIEKYNNDPQKLFDDLSKHREKWGTVSSLVDQLIINNVGMEMYMKISESSRSYDEKLMWGSLIEISNDIIIEERYDASRRRGFKIPIKLTQDRYFRKEYKLMTEQGGEMGETFEATNRALEDAMRTEKKKSTYGIKTRVDTKSENQGLKDT